MARKNMGRNLPCFYCTPSCCLRSTPLQQMTQQCQPAPVSWGTSPPPQHSTILCLFCLSSPLIHLHLQISSLASVCNISNLLAINPLFMLHQNSHAIHSKLHDGCLVLDGVFILAFLRVFRKGELNLCLSSIFMRHDDGGKKEQKAH